LSAQILSLVAKGELGLFLFKVFENTVFLYLGYLFMSQKISLRAQARQDVGRGASRRLRRLQDLVPGIVYGGKKEVKNITIEHRFILKALESETFFSQLINLEIDGEKEQVILKDLQRHPFKPKVLHLDLMRVSATEKLTMHIPLHFIGEDEAPGVKEEGGIVSHLMVDVMISCFPQDLPEFIEVDISHLKMDEVIHLSQLKLPPHTELVALSHHEGDEHYDQIVVSIHAPRAVLAQDSDEVVADGEVGSEEAGEEDSKKSSD
jgi:large subunit ribosomal protein L25